MTRSRYFAIAAAALLPFAIAACPSNKETEPVAPSAQPSAAPTPVVTAAPTPTVMTPEVPEAGADVSDAADGDAADARPKQGGPSNLAKCCKAIEQNQNSAPPEQKPLYAGFIAACKSGAIPPQFANLAPCK